MVSSLLNLVTDYIGIIISAVLPVILIWYFKTMERRRIHKDEQIAADLKREDEKVARELKEASVDIADDLRKHMDVKIASINESISDLGKRIDIVNTSQIEISKRVDIVSINQQKTRNDQQTLIQDLQKRADMTNGNIANILNDIMDVQEAVEDVSDNLYELPPLSSRQNTRKTNRRLKKRRRISTDSDYQENVKHHYGDHIS